jgi:hypothetical protein
MRFHGLRKVHTVRKIRRIRPEKREGEGDSHGRGGTTDLYSLFLLTFYFSLS